MKCNHNYMIAEITKTRMEVNFFLLTFEKPTNKTKKLFKDIKITFYY